MSQGLVQAAQAIHVGHNQLIIAWLGQGLGHTNQEGAAVQQAREDVAVGAGELGLQRHHARRAQTVLQPYAAPQAGLAAAHAQTHSDLGPLGLGLQQAVGQGAVLRHGQGGEGGARALWRQWAKAQ
ncbi:hypothetical protein D3C75_1027450 [compost metagenome]